MTIKLAVALLSFSSIAIAAPIGGVHKYFGNLDPKETCTHRVLAQSMQPITFSAESTGLISCCLSSGTKGELLCTGGAKHYCVITYIPTATDELYFTVANDTRVSQAYWGKAE